jgi:O-antigen/teichoic acid export membrane protein
LSIGESLRKQTLWVVAGDVGFRVFGLLTGVILARLLLPEEFGLVVTAQVLTGVMGYVAAGGMSDALVRAPTVSAGDRDTVFTAQLGVCLLIFGLLNLIAPGFAAFFNDPRLDPVLRVAALTFLLKPFMGVPLAILQREMRFKELSLVLFATLAVSSVVSVAMALAGLGVWSLLWGGLAGSAVRIWILIRIAPWLPRLAWDRVAVRQLGSFGIRFSALDLIQFVRIQTANAIVGRGLGIADVGLYNKADSLAEIPYEMLGLSAYQTLFRTLAVIRDERQRSAALFLRALTVVTLYAAPCYIGLIWVAEPFVVVVFGEPWRAAALPLQVLAAGGMLRIIASLGSAVAAAHDRLNLEIAIQLKTLGLLTLGAVCGLPWGIGGVALGSLPGLVYGAVRMYRLVGDTLGIGWSDLAAALKPVLWLNAFMTLALAIAWTALANADALGHEPTVLALMVVVGAVTYAGPFLLAPASELREESQRLRHLIASAFSRARRR